MEARMGEGEAEMALLAAGRTDVSAELHCSLANAFRHICECVKYCMKT